MNGAPLWLEGNGQPMTDPPKTVTAEHWPQPQPLPDGLPPVARFDLALLPHTLRPWIADICERTQCPPDFVAVSVMAALGSVLGRKVGIRPQARTDWTVVPNQWALIVGRPGAMKSPAIEAAIAPVKALAAKAGEAHRAAAADHGAEAKAAKLRADEREKLARDRLRKDPDADIAHLLRNECPEPPTLRRYIAVDSNAASLGELHRQNPNGLLVHRDEMVSLLRLLDREDQAEARGFYLTGWNGDSAYVFDRIERGLNLDIPGVCLSLLGGTQPGRLAEYVRHAVRGGAGDDGLLQRFGLMVWPDIGGNWRNVDRWPDSAAKREAFAAFERMDRLRPADTGAQQDPGLDGGAEGVAYLRFSGEALELFTEWRAALENRLRSGDLHPAMESHLAKYRKLVPGLALILHLADGGTGAVGERPGLQALAWAEYLETHAVRVYGSLAAPEIEAARAILAKLRGGDLPERFGSRDVWRPGWAKLTDRQTVGDALDLLVEMDWLATEQEPTAGRTRTVYVLSPRASSG